MSEAAHPAQHDFWRPPMQAQVPTVINQTDLAETCERCETEFIVGSRYCHSCGALRQDPHPGPRRIAIGVDRMGSTAAQLDLAIGPLIAFAFGIVFLMCALGVSFVFSVRTALDWQAIQLWRIEWLLAAVAAF